MDNYKIEELDPSKTYLIGVEVGDSSKDEVVKLLTQAKEVCEAKGIKAVYYAMNRGAGAIKVRELVDVINNTEIKL